MRRQAIEMSTAARWNGNADGNSVTITGQSLKGQNPLISLSAKSSAGMPKAAEIS